MDEQMKAFIDGAKIEESVASIKDKHLPEFPEMMKENVPNTAEGFSFIALWRIANSLEKIVALLQQRNIQDMMKGSGIMSHIPSFPDRLVGKTGVISNSIGGPINA